MNKEVSEESWWLMSSSFPDLNWARLRVTSYGEAEVLDMDGVLHRFSSPNAAKEWLLEDEFVSYSSLDGEDEMEYGINLAELVLPSASTAKELVKLMYVQSNV
ncbi:hypothetical protein [Pseudoteredinibacter isoporae]|uniref:Uncharacterized protein n=1 Tax=Pseudoteredinibacter isoporae TaxID=570281 RepID=A0A7X0JVK1_9GAMM|nr:hypothetical protein [Pseudoteredinibacter isoporae]MBB6522967.1 hypothetical protein [Pseudoteredinibacter isoporae]NHO88491.1 hypothetical protein [Pseudoteredinibacter isoporae]NIB22110.1 hypothetical protein [Pseudoteredinibacter isoporae]